ncbi:MAG TPA: hypothetical protein PK536_04085 [Ignavibacteria bacterium]|nr:hypothetical protein [Bacteroidota bacterium]HRI84606.1 hypothetical protein [Ignavibacteria bacterium]HRJ98317.1 hypothetical protein [Ignavibacteria bacterium]
MKIPVLIFLILITIFITDKASAQSDFLIQAGCNLCESEKGKLLRDYIAENNLQILRDNCYTTDDIRVIYREGVVDFGRKQENLTSTLNIIMTGWILCKEDLSGTSDEFQKPEESSIFEPLIYIPKRIAANWSFRTSFVNQYRNLSSLDYYVNPYFQVFGGDPLGIPFAYGSGVGLTAAFGTSYSGPMETDFVKGGLHLALFEVSVTSRIKEFVLKYSANTNKTEDTRNTWLGNWNNLYAPHLGMEFAMELPIFRLSYFTTIDTLQDITDNPVIVRNEVTGKPMKNNVVRGEYFGFELRTPNLIFYNSTRAKFYFAKQFGEYHLGFSGREMKIDEFVFDFRINATFPGKRDFQLLTELYFDSPWIGFANKAFGFGPSVRFGQTPSNNFGIISAFINARFKIGDFFDKNIY